MAEYELTITKRQPNPQWKPEPVTADYYDRREWERTMAGQPQYLEHRQLTVTVTEETFAAIRKAAVETL